MVIICKMAGEMYVLQKRGKCHRSEALLLLPEIEILIDGHSYRSIVLFNDHMVISTVDYTVSQRRHVVRT